MDSLGQRNKNPFNLRANKVAWLGKVGSNKGFVVFDTLEHGLRAGLINLATQVRRSNSLCDLVHRYAPPSENDSMAYYYYLTERIKVEWFHIVHDRYTFLSLAYSIACYEGTIIPLSYIKSIDKQYHIFDKHLALLKKNIS